MSAAASPIANVGTATHAVLVPLSYFFLPLTAAAHIILGVIIEATRGTFIRTAKGWKVKQWAHIPDIKFRNIACVSHQDTVVAAIALLEKNGYIRQRKNSDNLREYQDALAIAREHTAIAKCDNCGVTGVTDLPRGAVPTPHGYLTDLPTRLCNSARRILGYLLTKGFSWALDSETGNHVFVAQPRVILANEFAEVLDLSINTVLEALAELEKLGFVIAGSDKKGVAKAYTVGADNQGNFPKAPKRTPRVISVSFNRGAGACHRRPKQAQEIEPDSPQPTENTETTPPDETVLPKLFGTCRNCGFFGLKRIIEMPAPDNFLPETPVIAARDGPWAPKHPKNRRIEPIPDDLREIYACVAPYMPGFGVTASVQLLTAIKDASRGAPREWLENRFYKRRDAIAKAKSPGILVSISSDPGDLLEQQQQALRPGPASKKLSMEYLTRYAVDRRISTGRARELLEGQGYECE